MSFTGRKHSPETILRMSAAQKGRIISPEHRDRIRKTLTGRKASPETRKRLRESMRLRPHSVWEKMGDTTKGVPKSKDHKRKISEALRGKKKSIEHRKHMSEATKGCASRYTRTKEINEKMRQSIIRRMQTHPGPFKDTSIEVAVRKGLEDRGIGFYQQHNICGRMVDFMIPQGMVVVECDGCYWHCCPICRKHTKDERIVSRVTRKDKERTGVLVRAGYVVVRFWGHEIKSDVQSCIDKIEEAMVKNESTTR